MRICVIFNPAARGNKARHFRRHLNEIGGQSAFKATAAPGDARRLAAEAVAEGFCLVVAAGGDGTVNEVLNGIGDAPDGFARARFGVLPLGTVNVFARELKIPLKLERAWEILQRGREMAIDLPRADFSADGKSERRYFAQLAGAGFDARAIELVDWQHKKKVGPLAYVIAGLKALREAKPQVTAVARASTPAGGGGVPPPVAESRAGTVREPAAGTAAPPFSGELVLIGNGKFYGGPFEVFPQSDLRDGQLEICVFPRVDFRTFLCSVPAIVARQRLPEKLVRRFQAAEVELSSDRVAAFELDGEWVGKLPVKFSVERGRLRVAVP